MKAFKLFMWAVLIFVFAGPAYAASYNITPSNAVPSSYAGLWHFDNINGSNATFTPDETGVHNGYVIGASNGSGGYKKQAYHYDGVDDYINYSHVLSGNNLTFGAWAKWTTIGNDQSGYDIVLQQSPFDDSGFEIFGYSGRVWCWNGYTNTNGSDINTSTWYHVMCRYNSTHMCFYLNGVQKNCVASTASVSDVDMVSGFGAQQGLYAFNGTIDEVVAYNRALNDAEILALYNHYMGYPSVEACFDDINNTADGCVLGVSNYSETFSALKVYSFSDIALSVNNKSNVSVDFNNSYFMASSNGLVSEVGGWNHKIENAIIKGSAGIGISGGAGMEGNYTYNNFNVSGFGNFLGFGTGNPNSTIKILNSVINVSEKCGGQYSSNLYAENVTCYRGGLTLSFTNTNNYINNMKFLNGATLRITTLINNLTLKNSLLEGGTAYYSTTDTFTNSTFINNTFAGFTNNETLRLLSNSDNNLVEDNTFNGGGNITYTEQYLSSYSPMTYGGNNFNLITLYLRADLVTSKIVSADDTNVSSIVNGTNTFRLWLVDIPAAGLPWSTMYVEETPGMSCAAVAAAYGGACYLDEAAYWTPNGYGNDYTANSGSAASIITGYTNPSYLTFSNITNYNSVTIRARGNSTIKNNIFNNTLTPILTNTTGTNNILQNTFLDHTPTSITGANYCYNSEGNFYEESLTPVTEDCGQANITAPEESQAKNGTFSIEWKKQSSVIEVLYALFIQKVGQTLGFLGYTNNTYYPLDTTEYNDSNYTIEIIPYLSDLGINSTHAARNFTIDNPPAAPQQKSPASEAILTDRTPLFEWNASQNEEGTIYYMLVADNDSDFSSPEINITTTALNYTAPADLYFSDYFWKVRANDSLYLGNFSDVMNFTIIINIACALPSSTVNFSSIGLHEVLNTTEASSPIIIENSGNSKLNISVNATDLWQYFPNPSRFYQYRINLNETGAYEDALNESWNNFSQQKVRSIEGLKYPDDEDAARIDIQIEAPEGEGAGNKSSLIGVWCERDE